MKDYRIKEERYNEAKKEFEKELEELKKAERAYKPSWWGGEECGITPESFDKLIKFLDRVNDEIPARGYITFSNTAKEENNAVGLTTVNKKFNILSDLISFMRSILNRINGKTHESEEATINDAENVININEGKIEEEIDIDESKENAEIEYNDVFENKKKYNVEELIENCRKALENLKEKSEELDEEYEKNLNDSPSGKIIETIHDGPGILDDYRQGSWGIERICLDGFQNHLASDARGTKCYLHFLIDSGWVDRDTALKHRDEIKEVRFSDNGAGFTPDNLFYLHSTKTSEDISAGQFGEGMKLASIAAVNLGLELEFQSRNWRAKAIGEEKRITNTRNNDEVEIRKQLIYDVEVYDGDPIVRF